MTKQEEIREGIRDIILESLIHEMWCEPAPEEYGDVHHTGYAIESMNKTVCNILTYLHSQGVAFIYDIQAPLFGKQWARFGPLIGGEDAKG